MGDDKQVRKVGLISDTHGTLRNGVFQALDGVDLILHAGDIGSPDIITQLETIAPVKAVHGNTDGFDIRQRFGDTLELELAGKNIIVTHGHLFGAPTVNALRVAFPTADLIMYGHTHNPLLDETAKPVVVNPGAAGPARFKLKPSVALLELPSLTIRFVDLG